MNSYFVLRALAAQEMPHEREISCRPQRENRTFTQTAARMSGRIHSSRTIRTYAGAAIAYAAFARVRSIGISVAQQFSPNRPLDRAKKVESQTVLSLHRALTHKVRDLVAVQSRELDVRFS